VSEEAREAVRAEAETVSRRRATAAIVLAAALVGAPAALVAGPGAGAAVPAPAGSDAGLTREEAPLDPDQATQLFREANVLYAEGAYDGAATRYERVLAGGIENADVLYNLANAYFKAGATGRAVLNYERALKLQPGHEDARANLAFVSEMLADRQASVGGPLSELLGDAYARATPGRLSVLASLFYFVLVAALIAGVLRGGVSGWTARLAVVMGIHLVVAGGLLAMRLYQERSIREAVVLVPEVAVRTGPGDDFVLEFRLHEGTKVRAREDRGDWVRISVGGSDLEGWLPAGSLEEI
jgi:tetratricopeptide (TPR) repeat protein